MDGKLKIAISIFLILLLVFISIMIIGEYRNMDRLREEYPNLVEEVYMYRKDRLRIWAISLILEFLIPLLFLVTNFSQKISFFSSRGRGLFKSGIIYGIIYVSMIFLINLPINYYASFYLGHKYGLSNQTIFRWMELNIKGFLVNNIVMVLFLWLPYYIMIKSPRTWWLQLGILMIPIMIIMVFISPLVIDPIFNRYTSIEDEKLGQEISKLLEKAEISDASIYRVDKSKDTKTMNAYMTGIGKSKRIVLWDTTIDNLDEREVLCITAHEIGHYVSRHIWKNILIASVGTLLLAYLVYLTSNWILEHSYSSFGFRNIFNYASVPLFIMVINFYSFLGNPIMNYVSRYMEREADAYEIMLTDDREAAITAMEKLYKESLGLPRSSKLYKIWYHSHPTLEERVQFYKGQ